MQALNKLKAISKKNAWWGVFNFIIVLPLMIYGQAIHDRMQSNNTVAIETAFAENISNPIVLSIFIFIFLNLILDFATYINLKNKKFKQLMQIANLIFILIIINYIWHIDKNDVLIVLPFLFYKIYQYFNYYKICNDVQHSQDKSNF